MSDGDEAEVLVREGDEQFSRGEADAALASWAKAIRTARLARRAPILARIGFARKVRGQRLLRVLQAIEEAFPNTSPFVSDGMAVWLKLNTFLADSRFLYFAAKHDALIPVANWHWNLNAVLWAVKQVERLPGDFVELGVFKGHTTAVMADHLDFARWERRWFLFDTFDGIPEDQQDNAAWSRINSDIYKGTYSHAEVAERFAGFPNIEVIQGRVPEILHERCPERIAFLHMDLNNAAAEIAALDFLFDRIVPGGVIVFDDYVWAASGAQHVAEKSWFADRGLVVLELPTGQGIFVKPAS